MTQEYKTRQKGRTEETHAEVTNTDVTNPELAEATDATLENIDDVLDEQIDAELLDFMDDVLEEDAEAFVRGYIQQGGQ